MDASFQQAIEAASKEFAGGKSIPHAECRRSRRPNSLHHHARRHAVRAFDRRRQPSLDREHGRCDIVTGAAVFVGACRRLLAG